jgi:hypothetical protein
MTLHRRNKNMATIEETAAVLAGLLALACCALALILA